MEISRPQQKTGMRKKNAETGENKEVTDVETFFNERRYIAKEERSKNM